jgi:hypothetical protein
MKGQDLIVGSQYITTGGLSSSIYLRNGYKSVLRGTLLECLRKPSYHQGQSSFRVVEVPSDGSHLVKEGDEVQISNHSNISPFNGTDGGMSRANRAKGVRNKISVLTKRALDLNNDLATTKEKIETLKGQAEDLERFETDEDELAHMLHTLLTRGGQMTPDDIKQLLVARNATNKL